MDKHEANRVPLGDGESSMEEVFLIKLKDAIDKNLETPDFGVNDEFGYPPSHKKKTVLFDLLRQRIIQ